MPHTPAGEAPQLTLLILTETSPTPPSAADQTLTRLLQTCQQWASSKHTRLGRTRALTVAKCPTCDTDATRHLTHICGPASVLWQPNSPDSSTVGQGHMWERKTVLLCSLLQRPIEISA